MGKNKLCFQNIERFCCPYKEVIAIPQSIFCLSVLWRHLGWSSAQLKQRQDEQLRKLVSWAYDRVPLYQAKFREAGITPAEIQHVEDLQHLPILER